MLKYFFQNEFIPVQEDGESSGAEPELAPPVVPPVECNAAPAEVTAPASDCGKPAASEKVDAETRAPMCVKSTFGVVC